MPQNQSTRKVTVKSRKSRAQGQRIKVRSGLVRLGLRRRPRRVNALRTGVIQSTRQNFIPVSYSNQSKTRAHKYTVKHSEVVESSLNATGPKFSLMKRYDINPGNSIAFPWLHTIARCYDKYSFKKFSATFIPYVATTQVGDVCMTFIADPR